MGGLTWACRRPDVKTALSDLDVVGEDIAEIRRLLERLVELEEQKLAVG
jgi:hypothetical protein